MITIAKMGRVRPFVQDDIPQVAALQWKVLHGKKGYAPQAAETYLEEIFFASPWYDSNLPSFVYEDHRGAVVGFQGVVPRRMSLCGTSIQAAYGTSLVVQPESRSSLAAFDLLKAFLSGKQDISLTDTANYASQQVWIALGGTVAVSCGMHWSRPLRPSLYGLHGLSRFSHGALPAALVPVLAPLSRAIDAVVTRMPSCPFCPRPPVLKAEVPDVDILLACLSRSSGQHTLHPEYEKDSLQWLLEFMGNMKAYGDLRQVVLRNESGSVAGWYIYYVQRGGVGEVVRIGASNHTVSVVLDHLFHDAWAQGAIALHGRLESRFAQLLPEKCCFFYQAGNRMLVHSRRPELLRLVHSNDALLTRLDGEWCLRISDRSLSRPRCLGGLGKVNNRASFPPILLKTSQ